MLDELATKAETEHVISDRARALMARLREAPLDDLMNDVRARSKSRAQKEVEGERE